MPISSLLQQNAFEPEITEILIDAFDRAWAVVNALNRLEGAEADAVRALLAKRIIATAGEGECNTSRLVDDAVGYIGRWHKLETDNADHAPA
jgi:hypothetical protein